MIEYKVEKQEVQVPQSITCDICKKTYECDNIEHDMEIQEFHRIHIEGGFASVFGDGAIVEGDFCQKCLEEKLGKYLRYKR